MKTVQAIPKKCGKCGRRLKVGHWIYSHFTGERYCWPGEGCAKNG